MHRRGCPSCLPARHGVAATPELREETVIRHSALFSNRTASIPDAESARSDGAEALGTTRLRLVAPEGHTDAPASLVDAPAASIVSDRELAIDASRGAAMLLVCLSHFADGYLFPCGAVELGKMIKESCASATPTFVLLSGAMAGYLHAQNPAKFSIVRAKLADRGLFLLTICHVLLVLLTSAIFGGLTEAGRVFFVTDMIAVALVAIPPLLDRWSSRKRVLMGVLLYAASTVLSTAWHPAATPLNAFTEILLGQSAEDGSRVFRFVFPLVPWLAIYLTATAVGGHLARMLREGRNLETARRFAIAGALGIAAALTMLAIRSLPDGDPSPLLRRFTSPMAKIPPSPAYVGFNLGVGLLILAAALTASVLRRGTAVLRALSLIGQASLFVFLLEYLVYDLVLFEAHLPYTAAWPLLFMLSLGVIWPLAAIWARRGYNRHLTIGYGQPAPRARSSADADEPKVAAYASSRTFVER